MIIIIIFGENNVLGPIYMNLGGGRDGEHGLSYISRLLFI